MAPDPLTIARRLTARGLVVIPVPRPDGRHDGKTPVLAWKRYQHERPTIADLEHWFTSAPMNLAVCTGHLSGVVVIDVDGDDGLAWAAESLPDTPWITTTAKGRHLWFQHPGGLVPNRVRLPGVPVDVRGDGGFVVAPGSQHRSGVWYHCTGDWTQPRSHLPLFNPAWLPTSFAPPERVTNKTLRCDGGFPAADKPMRGVPSHAMERLPAGIADPAAALELRLRRARAYLGAMPLPEIGQGSDNLTFVAACRLVRGFGLSATDAEWLLWDWCGHRPGWDRDWIAQKVRSACSPARKEPMGALL